MENAAVKEKSPASTGETTELNSIYNNSIAQKREFLSLLFKNNHDYIELRLLNRDNTQVNRQLFFNSIDEVLSYNLPDNLNIRVSIFNRSRESGQSEFAKTTGAIFADYDNMKITEVKDRIQKASLPKPSILINSGNGIHAYWILDKRAGEETVPVFKALASRTGADMQQAGLQAGGRLPGTYNVKRRPVKCEIIEKNDNIYQLEFIANALNVKVSQFKESIKTDLIRNVERHCIKSILKGVGEGQRNWALGRLTAYLEKQDYTKDKARDIIKRWNERNIPAEKESKLLNDFRSYWTNLKNGKYLLLGCIIENDPEGMENLKIHCNKFECPKKQADITRAEEKEQPKYNNRIFNRYHNIKGTELIIYGIIANAFERGINSTELKKALYTRAKKKISISRPTISKAIKHLESEGLITVKRTPGKPTFMKVDSNYYGKGYTAISNGAINGAIDGRITAGEFKLYVLIKKYAQGKGEAFPGVVTLAKEMGIDHSTVSNHLNELEQARYIERVYNETEKGYQELIIYTQV